MTRRSSILAITATLLASGCSESPFPLAPVSGRVTLDGEPVQNARVVFMPRSSREDGEAGPYSKGETDADGRYELTTVTRPPRSGAVIGTHRIIVSTRRSRPDPNNPMGEILDAEETIPRRYHDYTRTPLEFAVQSDGAQAANFDLSGH